MKTVLVTGGAGFIGSHLCERLILIGYNVVNIDNFNSYYDPFIKRRNIQRLLANPHYTLIEGDIRDAVLLDEIYSKYQVNLVVHLAALAGVRKSLDTPLEYIDIDIKGTVNLLESSRKHNIEKFIYASSSSVYGMAPVPFSENQPIDTPISPYAAAKFAGEVFCRTYASLYGLPIVCLRFFTVYGPRQRPEMAIHNFTRLIDQGMEIPVYGDGSASRDYTYIDDIIQGILSSLNLKCSYEVFNLGNSTPIRLQFLISLIEQGLGKSAKIKYLPMQKGDVEHTRADIGKAQDILCYIPATSIEDGIEKFIAWYKYKD